MNRENLIKLRDWTRDQRTLPLDMSEFTEKLSRPKKIKAESDCGTAACYLGAAPLIFDVKSTEWERLSSELFNIWVAQKEWDFLFNMYWPNDIEQCVNRTTALLEGKMPEDFDFDMRFDKKGDSTYMYE